MVTPLVPHADSVAGGALVMFGQLQGLAARHEVTLATLAGADAGDQAGLEALSSIGVEAHPVWRARALGPGRWTNRLQLALGWLKSHDPLRALKFREPGLQTLIDELARKQRFDVLQIEDNAVGEYRYPEGVPTVFTEHEVRDADELLLTSSTKEIMPITRLDGREVGEGRPGPMFSRLYRFYQEYKDKVMRGGAIASL